jgi:hypothetical protein
VGSTFSFLSEENVERGVESGGISTFAAADAA